MMESSIGSNRKSLMFFLEALPRMLFSNVQGAVNAVKAKDIQLSMTKTSIE
jgi:hypothetical protein